MPPRRTVKLNKKRAVSVPVVQHIQRSSYEKPKSVSEEDYKNLYADLKKFYNTTMSGKLTTSGVTKLVRYTMQLVEANKKLTGEDKKNLVLAVINNFINDALADSNLDEETVNAILLALSFSPMLIDAAVDYSNNVMNGKGGFKCC